MKILLPVSISLCFIFFLSGFDLSNHRDETFSISGHVTGFPDGTKFYLRNLATDAVFDSTTVQNNHFEFEGKLDDPPELIWLYTILDNKFIYTNLLIGNDHIRVSGDISDFPWNVEIQGSRIQDEYNYAQNLTKTYDMERDSLVQIYRELPKDQQQEIGEKIWGKIRKIDSITTALRVDYIKSHPDTYFSVIELGFLKNNLPKDTIQKLFDRYTPEMKRSKYARVIEVFLQEDISEIGDIYHDFEGINQNEEHLRFSEIRGHYTLLDFTAAYCGPCMLAAVELLEIHQNLSDSLTIVSFSQDPKREDWLKSIERDHVVWNSLWDGKGRYSETSIKYGVQGIPSFILINPDGIIIDKWVGYNENSLFTRLEKNNLK